MIERRPALSRPPFFIPWIAIFLSIPTRLHAQAGGGGSYSGGGGGGFGGGGGGFGGGGGGGGGDGGDGFGFLIWLHLHAWYIAIPVDVALIWFFWKSSVAATEARKRSLIRGGRSLVSAAREKGLTDELTQRDPDFDADRFTARVERAFTIAQEAWCAQDLSRLRPFVSDGIHERLSMQIAEQVSDGWQQKMTETRVTGGPRIQHVASDGAFDSVTVWIDFRSRICRLDRKTKEEIRGSFLLRDDFEECWTFLRRRGARTKLEGGTVRGLVEGQCPNCGAPLAMNAGAVCESCQGHIRSGEYDWVLTEITQMSEWVPPQEDRLPGLDVVMVRDPEFTVAALEDRVSVAFWRSAAAERDRSTAPLATIAAPAFIADREARWRAQPRHEYLGDCAVGAVRLMGIETGIERGGAGETAEDARTERAFVEVRWDGRITVRKHDPERPRELRLEIAKERSLRRTVFELHRPANARTAIDDAFTAAHCAGCGAPENDLARATCAFCGASLAVAEGEWQLVAIHGALDPEWRERRLRWERAKRGIEIPTRGAASVGGSPGDGSQPSGEKKQWIPVESREDLVRWALAVALGDGEIDERERAQLAALAETCRVDPARLAILEGAVRSGSLGEVPESAMVAQAWLGQLARIVMADGEAHREELRVLKQVGAIAGLGNYDIQQTVRKARRDLFQEARAARRGGNGRGAS